MRLRLLIASLLVGLGGAFMLPFLAIGNVTDKPAAAVNMPSKPPIVRCTDGTPSAPHFYFFDEGKESNGAFGPSADKGSDQDVKNELVRRLCGDEHTGQDRALVSVITRLYLAVVPPGSPLFQTSPDTPLTMPSNDLNAPRDAADELVRYDIDWDHSRVVSASAPKDALTLYMHEPDTFNKPITDVTSLSSAHQRSNFLKLRFYGSDVPTLLRLPCGFQPVFENPRTAKVVAGR